jgi:hypothetical protein
MGVPAYPHAESRHRTHQDEIAQISEANRLYLPGGKGKRHGAAGDHERRLRRLREIMDELVALTDWKKL